MVNSLGRLVEVNKVDSNDDELVPSFVVLTNVVVSRIDVVVNVEL